VVALVRAYASIANDLDKAGYDPAAIAHIKAQLAHFVDVREIVRQAAGEKLDLKAYEADMRHLLDTYIEADEPRKISPFDNLGLLELIAKTGIAKAVQSLPPGMRGDKKAVAETIENNVRRTIMREHLNDPAFYATMSALLDEVIKLRKERADEYELYLQRIAELAKRVAAGQAEDVPVQLDTSGKRALYNNLKAQPTTAGTRAAEEVHPYGAPVDPALDLALLVDRAVKAARPDGWRGVQAREQMVKAALYRVLLDEAEVERVFLIIKAQAEY
jgi:type I restriction enzyme R subunit